MFEFLFSLMISDGMCWLCLIALIVATIVIKTNGGIPRD